MTDPRHSNPDARPPDDGALSRRRLLQQGALFAGAGLGSTLLAACGGGSATTKTAAGAATTAAKTKLTKPVTVSLWTWAWPDDAAGGKELMAAFKKAEPMVDLQIKKFPFPDYQTALKTAMPNGTAGEIIHLASGSLLRQYAPFVAPLESYASRDWGAGWESGFQGSAIKEVKSSLPSGSAMVAIPQQYSHGSILFYNKKLFHKAGFDVPQTYDDLKAAAPKFQQMGVAPSIWGAKDQWPNTDWVVTLAAQWKPGVVEAAELGKASFTDPAIIAAVSFLRDSLKDGVWNKSPFATPAFPDAYALFDAGKAASAAYGSWGLAAITAKKKQDDYAAMLWPRLPEAPDTDPLGSVSSASPDGGGPNPGRPWRTVNVSCSINKKASGDKAEAAWRFIRFWCGEEGQRTGAVTWNPARPGIEIPGLSDQWAEHAKWMEDLGPYTERREFLYDQTRTALQDAIANVCVRNADPKSELARVDQAAERARRRA